MDFYRCKVNGKIVMALDKEDTKLELANTEKISVGSIDASKEKHLPLIKLMGKVIDVTVGEVVHPMTKEHYIEWIAIETIKGAQIKYLYPLDEPKASFVLADDDKLVSAYAYCNLHGLWETKI